MDAMTKINNRLSNDRQRIKTRHQDVNQCWLAVLMYKCILYVVVVFLSYSYYNVIESIVDFFLPNM